MDIKSTGAAGATFATAACLSANVREKDDYVNASIGGALAGSLIGVACECVILGHNIWCYTLIFCYVLIHEFLSSV